MAKIALSIKYRPTDFSSLTEQSAIKDILENQIKTKTFQHGYLFTGPSGTGKTTSARMFASMRNYGKGNPIEVDAASTSIGFPFPSFIIFAKILPDVVFPVPLGPVKRYPC